MSLKPNPAVVSQEAAQRLPRMVIWFCCFIYLLPGFFGRTPWRGSDMVGLAAMREIAQGKSSWLHPSILGIPVPDLAPFPYWIGAIGIKLFPFFNAEMASRIPFILLLALTMASTWYACYYLAFNPQAQPIPFAFGGEAKPKAYARVMADGGLLALLATLGLAQLSHETTPAMTQLSMGAFMFLGASILFYRFRFGLFVYLVGAAGLTLSGAANMMWLFGLGIILVAIIDHTTIQDSPVWSHQKLSLLISVLTLIPVLCLGLAWHLNIWNLKFLHPTFTWSAWSGYGQLFLWFLWPAWPLVLITIWRWRKQLFSMQLSRHIALPLWFALVAMLTALASEPSDRALLLGLPAMACLAAFALPTMKQSLSAFIDWFTLLFFTVCAITIWVIWLSLVTGFPSGPAKNIARLAQGFSYTPSWFLFSCALLATLAWGWLVRWRTSRNRKPIWRSMVLPAGGTMLCWVLLMTLGLPLFNYTQGYTNMMKRVNKHTQGSTCVEFTELGIGKVAALRYYLKSQLKPSGLRPSCPWLITEPTSLNNTLATPQINQKEWVDALYLQHPIVGSEALLLLHRTHP